MLKTLAVMAGVVVAMSAPADAVELTASNFDEKVLNSGKAAFVKFQAPWWGHCKSMKPAWDAMGDKYKDHRAVVIGDMDCTQHQSTCGKFGVQGYPTIKWFEANNATPKDYSGGRDATSLEKFAEGLAPKCLIDDTSECTDKEKKYIVKMQAEDAKKVAKQLKRLEGMKGGRMKAELKQWVAERINILKQL